MAELPWEERIHLACESWRKWNTLPIGPRMDRVFKEAGVRELMTDRETVLNNLQDEVVQIVMTKEQLASAHEEIRQLRKALADLVKYYEESEPYPTSDDHPLYAARAIVGGELEVSEIDSPFVVSRFRRKPTEIEAIRWTGQNTSDVVGFAPTKITYTEASHPPHLRVETLHGVTKGDLGDWILKGRIGDVWPCKPNVFADNYAGPWVKCPKCGRDYLEREQLGHDLACNNAGSPE